MLKFIWLNTVTFKFCQNLLYLSHKSLFISRTSKHLQFFFLFYDNQIIVEKKEELKVFRRSADKQGFVAQIEQILTEFKRYCIQPDELQHFLEESSEKGSAIQDKLHDLELIYQSFEDELM